VSALSDAGVAEKLIQHAYKAWFDLDASCDALGRGLLEPLIARDTQDGEG
jgi:hypothetical protein